MNYMLTKQSGKHRKYKEAEGVPGLLVGVSLLQHGLKARGFPLASQRHARFFIMTALPQFLDHSLAQHLLFQAAQSLLYRLMSLQFDLNQSVLPSSAMLFSGHNTRARLFASFGLRALLT